MWTVQEVASYLRVAAQSVYRWAANEKIPHHKVGGVLRFDPAEVKEWACRKPRRRGRPPAGARN